MNIGDHVVHPRHGVCKVVDEQQRTFDGRTIDYVVLEAENASTGPGDLQLMLPANDPELTLRPIMKESAADRLMEILGQEKQEGPMVGAANWRARAARAQSTIDSDNPEDLAHVVRDLARRAVEHLTATEGRAQDRARALLVGEISAAKGWTAEETARRMDEQIFQHMEHESEAMLEAA